MKRSLSLLAIIFDFRSIDAHVNCDGFVILDGHTFTLLKLTVNTTDSFCMVTPVHYLVFSFFHNIRCLQENDH